MKRSEGLAFWILASLMLGVLVLPGSLRAQGNFVYTNDDNPSGNTVSGFSVASNGTLTPVSGSPFATRGTGIVDGALSASNHVTVDNIGNFLFASNTGSNDVSVFSINAGSGTLSLVAGSPFATGGSGGVGISLSSTPDGRFLMAANGGSNNLTVFSIASSGAVTPIGGSPFPALSFPEGIKVSPDGKFLAVAEPFSNQVEMFSIASTGSLTSLGAFPGGSVGELAGVDINCANSLLYGGEYNIGETIVDGYSIASSGTLTPVPGSPFRPGVGIDSRVVLLSPDDKTLFVSNGGFSAFSNTITVFSAASNGSLSLVAGSPFPMHPGAKPLGTATSQDGSLLYVASVFSNSISVFSVASNGALTEVAGSPFPTGQPGGLLSLGAFPPKSCIVQTPTITSLSPTSAIAGGAGFTLTVSGTNFVSGSTVNFNGNARTTTFVSATQLSAAILASDIATTGIFNVTVTNPGDGTSNGVSFTVVAPQPTITSISPTSAIAGGAGFSLTVNGTNFVSGSTVNFNGSARTTTFVSATQLRAAILASDIATTGIFNVTVTNPGDGTSNGVSFTVVAPQPTITSISPTSAIAGGAGFSLTVNGTNFVSGSTVNFNGSARTTTFVSATQLRAAILASDIATTGIFNVTVTNPGDGTSNGVSFTVVAPQQATQNTSNFNGTPIPSGDYIWFNANFTAKGIPSTGATIFFQNSTIHYGTTTLVVPNAQITFSPSATCATTTFNTATNTWITTVPISGSDEILLSGLSYKLTAPLAGGTNPVTWTGTFTSKTAGITVNWKWGAAVYTTFSTDYNLLNIKPTHSASCSYNNSDHAGTPEGTDPTSGQLFKSFVTSGARGGGGSNFTGSWSGTVGVPVSH